MPKYKYTVVAIQNPDGTYIITCPALPTISEAMQSTNSTVGKKDIKKSAETFINITLAGLSDAKKPIPRDIKVIVNEVEVNFTPIDG